MAAGAIRIQPVDIIDGRTDDVLCQVSAGPRTTAEDVMHSVARFKGIPFRQQLLRNGPAPTNAVMENSERLGAGLFSNPEHTQPALHLTVLTEEEAEEKEGHDKAMRDVSEGEPLKDVPKKYRSDTRVVLKAVEHDPCALQFADPAIRKNRRLMTQCMEMNFAATYYADKELWYDRLWVCQVVNADGMFLGSQLLPDEMRDDSEVVMTAVQQNGHALQFASPELQNDQEVVDFAIRNNGTSLAYASSELRSDFDTVLKAVRQNRMAVVHALGGLRNDPDIRAAAGQQPVNKKAMSDLRRVESQSFSQRIKEKFHELDVDHDGFLSYDELYDLLKSGQKDIGSDDVQILFDALDTHKDGRIDFYEFCDFIHEGAAEAVRHEMTSR